jgi:CheY-like chemotaxis protein
VGGDIKLMRELDQHGGRNGLFVVPAADGPVAEHRPAGGAGSATGVLADRGHGAPGDPGQPDHRSLARVVLIGDDRRFRAVAATLLSQRGYTVAVGGTADDVLALALRERADVVVIDATASLTTAARQAARLDWLRPRVGVVLVSAESQQGLAALPLVPKWGSFDDVFAAIDRARPLAAPAAPPTAPASAARAGNDGAARASY